MKFNSSRFLTSFLRGERQKSRQKRNDLAFQYSGLKPGTIDILLLWSKGGCQTFVGEHNLRVLAPYPDYDQQLII